jgi:hypothetical protein
MGRGMGLLICFPDIHQLGYWSEYFKFCLFQMDTKKMIKFGKFQITLTR